MEDVDAAIAHLRKHDVKFRFEPLATAGLPHGDDL
jgi:hypothetical protein